MMIDIYDAFKDAGVSDDKARAVANAFDERFGKQDEQRIAASRELEKLLMKQLAENKRQQEDKLDTIINQLHRFDKKFDSIDHKLARIDEKFEEIDKRFDKIDERFERIDGRFVEMDEKMNAGFKEVDKKISNIDSNIAVGKWMLALIVITVVVPILKRWLGY